MPGPALKRATLRRRRTYHTRYDVPDKQLDDACRALVFERDGRRCVRCGSRANLQWAHVYSRRYKSVRWNPLNSMCLCAGCHLWWHHQPIDAVLWWVGRMGEASHLTIKIAMKERQRLDRKLLLIWLQQSRDRFL